MRLVLDTNVCLDLFVFDDPRCAGLRAALAQGMAIAFSDSPCRDEWLRVLTYPVLALPAPRRAQAVLDYDATLVPWSAPRTGAEVALPRCPDADDQKFLELAHAVRADALLSRDRALLGLAARVRRRGLFRIALPQDWRSSVAL
ncbi:MAG: PIN domain-containing protein [Dyella sp.]